MKVVLRRSTMVLTGAATLGSILLSKAIEIPGTARLNSHHWGGVSDLSCAAPGRCTVGGGYTDGSNKGQAFVDSSS